MKVIPFMYILMSRKTEASYTHLFRHINKNIFSLDCGSFTTDFERGLRNALRAVFGPEVCLVGCWFHYCQAIRRKASKIPGLLKYIRSDKHRERWYCKILCLILLPADVILEAFQALRKEGHDFNDDAVVIFLLYNRNQWIRKEGPSNISVFNQDVRTTAGVEAYNGALGKKIIPNGNFFRFVSTIQSEEIAKVLELREHIESGGYDIARNHKHTVSFNLL